MHTRKIASYLLSFDQLRHSPCTSIAELCSHWSKDYYEVPTSVTLSYKKKDGRKLMLICTWAKVALVFNIEFQKIQVSSLQSLGKPYRYLIRLTYSDDPVWHVCEPPCCWNNHTICKQMPTGSCEKALRGHSKRRLGNSWEFLLKDRRWQYSDPSFMTPISSNQVTYAFSNVISTYLLFLFIEIIFDCVLDRSKPYIEEFKSEISSDV